MKKDLENLKSEMELKQMSKNIDDKLFRLKSEIDRKKQKLEKHIEQEEIQAKKEQLKNEKLIADTLEKIRKNEEKMKTSKDLELKL